jgi:hypothetical protein
MKRTIIAAVIAVAALVFAVNGAGAAPGKLKCFSGGGDPSDPASCSISGEVVTFDTSTGGFAGAYITNSRNQGASLGSASYSFQYNCDPGDNFTTCVGGGSPRWSIPIDTGGNAKPEGYAFLDAAGCGSNGTVSTGSSSCGVNFAGTDYPNWAAFAAANPTYKIANALPFVITDTTEPGTTDVFAITVS